MNPNCIYEVKTYWGYFRLDENEIEVGKPIQCQIAVNHVVEPTTSREQRQSSLWLCLARRRKSRRLNRTTEKIPTWSLCYLINGDATALTDEEIRMVDEWVSQWQVEIVSPLMDEDGNTHPYFCHYPIFGLPTEVEDCEILYKNNNL